MKTKSSFVSWVILFLITVTLLLPARFYQSFSLQNFNIQSNLNVQYLNFVDLLILITTVLCVAFSSVRLFKKNQLLILLTCFFAFAVFLVCLIVGNKTGHIGELISKLLIVICSIIIANYVIIHFSSRQLEALYVLPLLVLVVSSFFVKEYGSYGLSRRPGSIGFGSNETAMLCCTLLFILLFKKGINILLRFLLIAICFASVFVLGSRRGVVIAAALSVIKLLLIIYHSFKTFRLKNIVYAFLIVGISAFLFLAFRERIIDFLRTSSLSLRFEVSLNKDSYFFLGERATIYQDGFLYFIDHFLFGSFGCDTIYAQGLNTHTHNMFLQFLVSYGFLFGIPIICYFLYYFLVSLRVCISKDGKMSPIFMPCSFVVIVIICEQFGYIFWNPKAFFWIVLSTIIIRESFRFGRADIFTKNYRFNQLRLNSIIKN